MVHYYRKPMILFLMLSALWGCEDRDATQRAEARDEAAKAGRLVLSSQQQVIMSDAEVQRARTTAPQRAAEQVVERIERDMNISELEAALAEIEDQLANITTQPHLAPDVSQRLRDLSWALLTADGGAKDFTAEQRRQRLDEAQRLLTRAVAAAPAEGKAYPNLLLGALYLTRARDLASAAWLRGQAAQDHQRTISRLGGYLKRRGVQAEAIALYPPDEAVGIMRARLEGDEKDPSARRQLSEAEDEVRRLSAQQETLKSQAQEYLQRFRSLSQQSQQLQQQAERTRGQERFELMQQSYEVRTGGENGRGATYYEEQYELTQSELARVSDELGRAERNRDRLAAAVADLEAEYERLRSSPVYPSVEQAQRENAQQRQNLLEEAQEALAQLRRAEQAYAEQRAATRDAFEGAASAFRAAERSAPRGDRSTRDFAAYMAERAAGELGMFWKTDADHYTMLARIVEPLTEVAELAEQAGGLGEEYLRSAAQARAGAEDAPAPIDSPAR